MQKPLSFKKNKLSCVISSALLVAPVAHAADTIINTHENITADTTYTVNAGDRLIFENINHTGAGGAILANTNLTFDVANGGSVQFLNNTASNDGGAISYNGSSKTLTLSHATFRGNRTNVTQSSFSGGGAFYSSGSSIVNISDAVFDQNSSNSNAGAYHLGTITSIANLTDVVFTNNTAGAQGGAIAGYGAFNIHATKDLVYDNNTSSIGSNFAYIFSSGSINITVDDGATLTIQDGFASQVTSASITKHGEGTLALNGDSALSTPYSGRVDIYAGTIAAGHANAFGQSTVPINFKGNGTIINNASGALTFGQKVNIDAGVQARFAGDQNIVLSNFIAGAGGLVKSGNHTLSLTNSNTYTGGTTIESGTLQLGTGGTTGSITGDITNNATLAINRSNALTLSSNISGTGNLTISGGATLSLTGNNTYTGGTTINSGNTLNTNTNHIQGNILNNGQLIFNQDTDGTYTGSILGTGTFQKDNIGTLTLAGATSAAALNVVAGNLNVAPAVTIDITGNATFQAGTGLGVNIISTPDLRADSVNFLGNNTVDIQGYDATSDTNTYTLIQTTNGINGTFDVTVNGVTLGNLVDLDHYLIGTAELDTTANNLILTPTLVWNNTVTSGAHGTFNIPADNTFQIGIALEDKSGPALGFGWDGTILNKKGTGTLILNGINTYTGLTNIEQGKLIVGDATSASTATIAGDVDVQSGATLAGHGQILGHVRMTNGSTISPGNSVGTITVGSISFEPGSTYEFEANEDSTADQIISTGTADIQGGTVHVLANGNIWKTTQAYTLVATASGVTGTYDNLTSNLAFLDAELTYDANNVYLKFVRNETGMGSIGGTENQTHTGWGVSNLGEGNPVYDRIVSMDRYTALAAFDNLSGEIHASTASALLNNSRYVRSAVNQHLYQTTPETDNYLWGYIWGHDGHIKSDGNAHRVDNKGSGLLLGVDIPVAPQTQLGIAMGYEKTNLDVNNTRQSHSDIDTYHVMLYGKTQAGPIDLRAGIGYARHNIQATRNIWITGLQSQNKSDYDANQFQVFIEGSHTFDINPNTQLTPYANIAYTHIKADRFTERNYIMPFTALTGQSNTNSLTTATLGINGQYNIGAQNQHAIYADLGWQFQFGDKTPTAQLGFINGLPSQISGASLGSGAALVGLGANFELKPDFKLDIKYEGEFGSKVTGNSLKLQVNWLF